MNDPVLLYDGTCGFCAESVRFVLRHDTRASLRFAALQSDFGRDVVARHPEVRGLDSMIWVERPASNAEQVLARSDAALRIAEYLGGFWTSLLAGRLVPRVVRDGAYDLVARHRHRLTGNNECLVPSPDNRERFID